MLIILDRQEKEPNRLTAKFFIEKEIINNKNQEGSIRLNRIFEIQETINRYIAYSKKIDIKWIEELNEHIEFFNDKYGQKE